MFLGEEDVLLNRNRTFTAAALSKTILFAITAFVLKKIN